jgi:hypothetical protein
MFCSGEIPGFGQLSGRTLQLAAPSTEEADIEVVECLEERSSLRVLPKGSLAPKNHDHTQAQTILLSAFSSWSSVIVDFLP